MFLGHFKVYVYYRRRNMQLETLYVFNYKHEDKKSIYHFTSEMNCVLLKVFPNQVFAKYL
jgi:hypothetical protein